LVERSASRGAAHSKVTVLDAKARIEEIARMLGGTSITATTRKHAAEMLGPRALGPPVVGRRAR
jgi:DNA repair protein RecN (Recombination protein N)